MKALERLKAGNRRFVDGERSSANDLGPERRRELAGGQAPFAVVLTCADSRVAPEHVFDQGLGDLFVLRVAGNIATTAVIGSIELAVQTGADLILVMGHSNCAAVRLTMEAVNGADASDSPHLEAIVEHVRPAVEASVSDLPGAEGAAVMERGVALNVHSSVACLQQDSELLRERLDAGALQVVGAIYSLETGTVEFLGEAAGD